MNIMVVGCGKIGSTILANLVAEGHDVTAVDIDPDVTADISNVYDVRTLCGNGIEYETLEEGDAHLAELFIALTPSDELNMLSCFLAKKMGARHTVARVGNPEFRGHNLAFMKQQLGISMFLNPEQLTASEILNVLKLPIGVKTEYFSRRNFEMIELRLKENSALNGLKLHELHGKYHTKCLICAVRRGNEVFIPDGNFELRSGDEINLTASQDEVQKFLSELGYLKKDSRSVMILGGSRTAYYLGSMLLDIGIAVKIVERDRQRCRELCEALPKAVIINADGAKQEILLEEGLLSADAFVSLTGMDEENILMSIFAASQNVPKSLTKIDRNEFIQMGEKLGLDTIISPKDLVSNMIVRYARALQNSLGSNVETMYKLMDGKAEALEFNVRPGFKKVQIPLKYLELKPNILIGGIIRGRRTIIPNGEDLFMEGDRVIVLATGHRLYDLADILK